MKTQTLDFVSNPSGIACNLHVVSKQRMYPTVNVAATDPAYGIPMYFR